MKTPNFNESAANLELSDRPDLRETPIQDSKSAWQTISIL